MKKDFLSGVASGAGKAAGTALVAGLLLMIPKVRLWLSQGFQHIATSGIPWLLMSLCLLSALSFWFALYYKKRFDGLLWRVRNKKLRFFDQHQEDELKRLHEKIDAPDKAIAEYFKKP